MKLWPLLFGLVVLIKAQTDYQYDYDDYDYEEVHCVGHAKKYNP